MPPYVPHYSPADLEQAKALLKIDNVGKVEQAYRAGQLTLQKKKELQRRYNELQREIDIQGGASGEIREYVQNVAKEWGKTWEAATKPLNVEKGEGFNKKLLDTMFHSLMATLATVAAQDIPGNVVERWALAGGAPDGLARAMNWAVWIPFNFLSTSTLLKPINMGLGAAVRAERAAGGVVKEAVKSGADVFHYLRDPVGWAIKNSVGLDSPEVKAGVEKIAEATKAMVQGEKVAAKMAAETVETIKPSGVEGVSPELEAIIAREQALGKPPNPRDVRLTSEQQEFLAKQGTTATEAAVGMSRQVFPTPQELQQQGIEAILRYYQERAQAFIRKGISHAQTAEESKGMDIVEILNRGPGKPLSAAETDLVGRTFKEVEKGFDESLKQAMPYLEDIAAGNRPDLRAAYEAHLIAMGQVNPIFLGGTGELGRGLEYLKTLQPELRSARMYDNIFRELGSDFLNQGTDAAISANMGRMALLSTEGRRKMLEEGAKQSTSGTLHTFYKHLLFSNPATHVVNLFGSKLSILANAIEKSAAARVVGGPPKEEAAANWAGMASAYRNLPRIIRQAVERNTDTVEKAGVSVPVGKFTPAGLLGLEDDIMTGLAEVGLIRGRATIRAINDGVVGKVQQKAYVDALLDNPETYKQLAEEVRPEVEHVLFHDPLSSWGEQIARGIREGPLDFLMPVVKFPINSLKMFRDWTPGLQYLSTRSADALAMGGEAEARFRARTTLSWMMANVIWDAALEEKIGWGGPKDPDANRIWRENNTQYHLGGIPIRWAEPFATPVALISDMAHLSNQMRPDDVEDFVGAMTLSLTRAVGNNYWLRVMEGITNAVNGMEDAKDPEQWMLALGKVAAQPAITLGTLGVAGSPVSRRVREIIDPEMKDVRNLSEYFMSQVPGMSKQIRPKLNYSAKPVEIPPTIGGRWLSFLLPPLRPKSGDEDPVGAILEKHELTLPDNWKSHGGNYNPDKPLAEPSASPVGTFLDGDQSHNWKLFSLAGVKDLEGKTWVERMQALDLDPNFQNKTRDQKQDKVNLLYQLYRERGWKALKQEDPKVAAAEEEAKMTTKVNRGQLKMDIIAVSPEENDQAYGVQESAPPPPPAEEVE